MENIQENNMYRLTHLQVRIKSVYVRGIDVRKTAYMIVALSVASLLLLATLIVVCSLQSWTSPPITFFVIFAVSGLVLSIQGALGLFRAHERTAGAEQAVANLETLNRSMRTQRHDFKNHMQVVSALLDMEEYDEARDYLKRVNNDLQVIGKALKTTQPAVNALLQAKALVCEQKKIVFDININSALDALPMASWQACRILGNLIDNAVDALEEANTPQPRIILYIEETEKKI